MSSKKILLILFVLQLSSSQIISQTITLRDTTNQFDYIIITIPEFVSSCEQFRIHKETVRDFRTLIVDTTQIYAEFDSSAAPEDNIRNFISYAGTFWREPRPNYFLLVGNVQTIPNFTIPPPNQSIPDAYSDYYYKFSIYSSDPTNSDFYVGRIPGIDSEEFENYFSKVIEYESDPGLQNWMNNNLFICPDDSFPGFFYTVKIIADSILPDYIKSSFITIDTSSVYYGNRDSIYKAINEKGCSVVWFIGVNSDSFFISPDYFNITDLAGLENDSKYFFTLFISPQSSILDTNTNLTKEMLVLKDAGSLGSSVITGITFWGLTRTYHQLLATHLFNTDFQSLGEIFDNIPLGPSGYYILRLANLWADPSLILKYDPTVDINEITNAIPSEYFLDQNYPNPFNPKTSIRFQLMNRGFVTLKVFNILGKEVKTLISEEKSSGNYEVEFDASNLSSGIYIYRLQAGNFNQTRKMILLK